MFKRKNFITIFSALALVFAGIVLNAVQAKKAKIDNIFLNRTVNEIANTFYKFNDELEEHKKPVLINAFGTVNSGNPFSKAKEVDEWSFLFYVENKENPNESYTIKIDFRQGVFQKPILIKEFPFGFVLKKLPKRMSLKRAIKIIRKIGFKDDFQNVVLKQALVPGVKNHEYIFEVSNNPSYRFLSVDTRTGKVSASN